jgi:hypothetical protein
VHVAILQHLSVKDIHNSLLASRGLHQALQDERVWHGLCLKTWGGCTDPHRWLPARPAAPLPGTPSRVNLPAPQTYRCGGGCVCWQYMSELQSAELAAHAWHKQNCSLCQAPPSRPL